MLKRKQWRCVMKFLLAVLTIHFIGELIGNKRKNKKINEPDEINERVYHPAEYELRK
jgi:hypothetical protein